MAEKQKKAVFGSLQPDVDPLLELNDLTAADFAPATSGEKEDFIQQRKSVSYWADAWRRLRKNVVAMVALGVIVDRKSTRLNSSHRSLSRMPSSA